MTALHGIVEDDNKNVCAIAIYNFPYKNKKLSQVFHKGVEIYVKEPYYKSSNRYLNIRIDDPRDIEFVATSKELKKASTADEHKQEGNKYFANKNFLQAFDEYEKAISLEKDETKLSLLWSNKTLVYDNLNCHNDALRSALKSLQFNPSNTKSIYQKTTQLIHLDKLEQAQDYLLDNEEKLPEMYAKKLKSKIKQKQDLRQNKIDWETVLKESDSMEYVNSKIAMKKSAAAGNYSFFCTQNIEAHEVLVIEKPIMFEKANDKRSDNFILSMEFNPKMWRMQKHEYTHLRAKLERLYHFSTQVKNKILGLWDQKSARLSIAERQTQTINPNDFNQKLSTNIFTVEDLRSQIEKTGDQNISLYLKASNFNHHCIANATYFNINNLMVIISLTKIKKGQEVFIMFIHPTFESVKPNNKWKILCDSSCISCSQSKIFMQTRQKIRKEKSWEKSIDFFKNRQIKTLLLTGLLCQCNPNSFLKYQNVILNETNLVSMFTVLCQNYDLCIGSVGISTLLVKITRKLFGKVKAVKSIFNKLLYQKLEKVDAQVE